MISELEDLIVAIRSSIVGSGRGTIEHVQSLMANYRGNDYHRYVHFDPSNYQRILIHGNEDFDLHLICWDKGQSSPIHDHPVYGCVLRVLSGELEEELYCNTGDHRLEKSEVNRLKTNNVSYIAGNSVVHQITALERSISLHLYSPPNYKPINYERPVDNGL